MWNSPYNWSTHHVPGPSDNVIIPTGVSVTIQGNTNAQAHTLTDGGELNVKGGSLTLATDSSVQDLLLSNGKLVADGTLLIPDSLTWAGGTLAGTGTIDAQNAMYMVGYSPKTLDTVTLVNDGSCTWTGGDVGAANGAVFVNTPGSLWVGSTGVTFNPVLVNEGALVCDPSGGTAWLDTVSNFGYVALQGGMVQTDTYAQYGGVTDLQGGTLYSINAVGILGGSLLGSGQVDATLVNAGTVDLSGGPLLVTGDYQQTGGGTLNVSLTGNPGDPGPLTVGGTAYLAGTLNVTFPPGFTPVPGERYTVLQCSALSGQFSTITGLPGPTVAPEYNPQVVNLAANLPVVVPQPTPAARPVGKDDLGSTVLSRPDAAAPSQPVTPTGAQPNSLLVRLDDGTHLGATAVFSQPVLGPTVGVSLSGGGSTGRAAQGTEVAVVMTAAEEDAEPAALNAGEVLVTLEDLESPPPEETLSGSDIAGSLLTGGRPRAAVLPQRGSAVAAVPTLVAGDDGTTAPDVDAPKEDAEDLRRLLIDPVWNPLPDALPRAPARPTSAAPGDVPPLATAGVAVLGLRLRGRRRRRRPAGAGEYPRL
jgi:hypothetical protein